MEHAVSTRAEFAVQHYMHVLHCPDPEKSGAMM
jgi:hypothetical protein